MAFFDKITKATQDVVRGTKDLTDTARWNSMIADEQKQIQDLYTQIGKLYYKTASFDSETPLGNLCASVRAAEERIETYRGEVCKIKGVRRCTVCGADAPIKAAFCGVCGAKLEESKPTESTGNEKQIFCTHCGTPLSPDALFCTACGQKQNQTDSSDQT